MKDLIMLFRIVRITGLGAAWHYAAERLCEIRYGVDVDPNETTEDARTTTAKLVAVCMPAYLVKAA